MSNDSLNQNNPQVKPGDPEYNPHGVNLTPRFSVGQKVRVKKGYQRENQDGRYKPGVYDGDTLTIKESGTWGTTVISYAFDEINFVIKERWLEAESGGSEPHDDEPRAERATALDELLKELAMAKASHDYALKMGDTAYTVGMLRMKALFELIDLLLAERAAAYRSVTLLARSTSGVVINSEGYQDSTAPAQPSAPAGYVVKHFDCCQGNDETCPGCDNGYGQDVLYKIEPEQPAQQPIAVALTGTPSQPEAARAKHVRLGKAQWSVLAHAAKGSKVDDGPYGITSRRIIDSLVRHGYLLRDVLKQAWFITDDGRKRFAEGR